MQYEEIIITPDMAKTYLMSNKVNRTLNVARVNQYAIDMKAGNWQLNGEGISFYEDGSLANGQHRLEAIIKANVPIKMTIIKGLPSCVSVQDRGRNRSISDILQLKGLSKEFANAKTTAMAKLHYYIQNGIRNVSDSYIEKFITKNSILLQKLSTVHKVGSGHQSKRVNIECTPVQLACFYAMNSGECPEEKIFEFLKVLSSGIPDSMNQKAALVCRNDILSGAIACKNGGGTERKKAVFQIEKAISDFNSGYERKKSYASHNEPIYSNHKNNTETNTSV